MDHFADSAAIFAAQKAAAPSRRLSFGLAARRAALARLADALDHFRPDLLAALAADLGKPEAEALIWEFLPLQGEISHARRHLGRWMRPRRAATSLTMLGTGARIRPEPRGVSLIIGPWNFPMMLTLGPLVSALAAGNAAILKPSELTPATSSVVARMLRETFPADLVAVAEGGPEVATRLLDLPFDHIFFTGGATVGRIVMQAASRHLTPVTLELGGKSPVIVGPGADIAAAARHLVWGKFTNAGQTCVAPDHIFVHRSIEAALTTAMTAEIARAFGATPEAIAASPDYARVVNDRHHARLKALLEEAQAQGAQIATGGQSDAARRYLAPTLLKDTTDDMRISQEEIFGPILPVIAYDDLEAVIDRINAGPKPLALYVFERAQAFADRIIAATSSGTVGVNLNVVQFAHPNLPFGGVGASGMGAAHGYQGFRAFSHFRPVLRNHLSALPLLFPPYGRSTACLTRVLGWLTR